MGVEMIGIRKCTDFIEILPQTVSD